MKYSACRSRGSDQLKKHLKINEDSRKIYQEYDLASSLQQRDRVHTFDLFKDLLLKNMQVNNKTKMVTS